MGGRGAATWASSLLMAALLFACAVAPPQAALAASPTRRRLLDAAEEEPEQQDWSKDAPAEASLEAAGSQLEPAAVTAGGGYPEDEDLVFGDDVQPARNRPRAGGKRRRRKRPRRPPPADLYDAGAAPDAADAGPLYARPAYEAPEAETATLRPRRRKLRRRPPPGLALGAEEAPRYHSRYRDDELPPPPPPPPRRRNRIRRPGVEDTESGLPLYNDDGDSLPPRRRRPVHQFHARIPEDEPVPLERVPERGHGDGIPLLEAGNPPLPHENIGDDAFLSKPRRRNRLRYQNSQPHYGPTVIAQGDSFGEEHPDSDTNQRSRKRPNLSTPVHFDDGMLPVRATDDSGFIADKISPQTGTVRFETGITTDLHHPNEGEVHNEAVRPVPLAETEGKTAVFSMGPKDSRIGQTEALPHEHHDTPGSRQEAELIKQVAVNTAQSLSGTTSNKQVVENKVSERSTAASVTTAEKSGTTADVTLTVTSTESAPSHHDAVGTPTPVPISLSELLRIKNITLGDVVRESEEPAAVSRARDKLRQPQQHRRIPIHRLPTPTELFARKRGSHHHTVNNISGPTVAPSSVSTAPSTTVFKTKTPHTLSVSTVPTTVSETVATKRANDITVGSVSRDKITTTTTVPAKITPTADASSTHSSVSPPSRTPSPSVKLSPAEERVPTSRPITDIPAATLRSNDTGEKLTVESPTVNVPLMMQESPAIDPVKATGEGGANSSASSSKSRVVIMPSRDPTVISNTENDSEDIPDEDILELLRTQAGSARLAKILQSRNMTLQELIEHRERGSSHQHLSDIFSGKKKTSLPHLPVSLKTQNPAHDGPMQISITDPSRNPRIMTGPHRETSARVPQTSGSGGDSNNIAFHPGLRIDQSRDSSQKQQAGTGGFRFPDAVPQASHPAPPPPFTIFHDPPKPDILGHIGNVVELGLNTQRVLQPVKPNGFFIAEVTEESNDIREQPVTAGHPLQRINSFYDVRPNAINGPELQAVLIHQLTQQSAGKQAEGPHKTNWRLHHEAASGGATPPKEIVDAAVDATVKPETDIVTADDDDDDETAAVREDDGVNVGGAESDDVAWLSPSARSAVTAGGTVLGAALLVFLAVLVGCRVRQRRRRARARSPIITNRNGCGTLGAKRGLGGTLVLPGHKRKKAESSQRQYLEDDFAEPPRRYYLWRTIRKTLQYK